MDKRKVKSGLTRKQLLEKDFKAAEVGDEEWDVIVIGSGCSGLVSANLISRAGLKARFKTSMYIRFLNL